MKIEHLVIARRCRAEAIQCLEARKSWIASRRSYRHRLSIDLICRVELSGVEQGPPLVHRQSTRVGVFGRAAASIVAEQSIADAV